MTHVTFVSEYNAVHRLWNPELSERENVATYRECANAAGHGHLYHIEVTVGADASQDRPVVIDRASIERIQREVLAPRFANADINTTFGIAGFISTGENVVRVIWDLVARELDEGVKLVRVKLVETAKNSFEYLGDSE